MAVQQLLIKVLLLHFISGDLAAADEARRYNVLKFGASQYDYIIYKPDMRPFENAFTVCAWIRKLTDHGVPTWFSYAAENEVYEIQISDMGRRTRIFGDYQHLNQYYTVPGGTWFHNCVSWSLADRMRDLYINGNLVNRQETPAGRTLGLDGYLVIGNEQSGSYGGGMDSVNPLAGELFKLNMFSKKLTDAEIQEMSNTMCSVIEDKYGEERSIKWEDVLLQTRHGNVWEIASGCPAGMSTFLKQNG